MSGDARTRGPRLVSRSLLRYRLFSLKGIAPRDRSGALQAQLAAWQPFPDSLYVVDLHGDDAQVFAADRESSQLLQGRAAAAIWPDSLLHEPGRDGLRLIEGLEGCEGQAWFNGVLTASRWWAREPDGEEWLAFARLARAGDTAKPSLQSLPWVRPTRPVLTADQLTQRLYGQERLLAVGLGLVFVAFSTAGLREAWDAKQRLDADTARLESLKQETSPLLAARERALAMADQSAALIKPMLVPLPLEIIEQLNALLPKGSQLKEFDLENGSVKVALELPPDISRARVVAALEAGGWFSQVNEVKDGMTRSWVSFEMKLSSVRPAEKAGTDAGLNRAAAGAAQPLPTTAAPDANTKSVGAKT